MRKFLIGLLVFILINTIGLLILSYTIKDILVDGVIKEVIVSQISIPEYKESNYQHINTDENINKITDNERVREVLKSDEVSNLINKYMDLVVEGLIDEEKLDEIELEKDMIEYIKDNKEELEKITGQQISDEDIENLEKEIKESNLDKNVKESITTTSKSMPKGAKDVLKGYQFLVSLKFKLILIIISILDIILIAILQKSLYKWIKHLALSLITNGIFAIIVGLTVYLIVFSLTRIKLNMSSLLMTGIGITIVGILMQIIYKVLDKNISKKEESYEIS